MTLNAISDFSNISKVSSLRNVSNFSNSSIIDNLNNTIDSSNHSISSNVSNLSHVKSTIASGLGLNTFRLVLFFIVWLVTVSEYDNCKHTLNPPIIISHYCLS